MNSPLHTPSGGTTAARRPARLRPWLAVGSATVTAIVGVWAVWSAFASGREGTSRSATAEGDRPFVAVLPFENLNPDTAGSFFAGGISEEITSTLSNRKAAPALLEEVAPT